MKLSRLIITIAIIIVVAWCIGQLFKLTAWLLNGLVGFAAVVLIVALIYRWFSVSKKIYTSPQTRTTKKDPLKIEREPSKEK